MKVNNGPSYTQGAWTPDLQFGGAKVGITYTQQSGVWQQVGKIMSITGDFILSSKGSSVGQAHIFGLPLAPNQPASRFVTGSIIMDTGVAATVTAPMMLVQGNTTEIQIFQLIAGSLQSLSNTDFGNFTHVTIAMVYDVA
jgi:hypothetical protein